MLAEGRASTTLQHASFYERLPFDIATCLPTRDITRLTGCRKLPQTTPLIPYPTPWGMLRGVNLISHFSLCRTESEAFAFAFAFALPRHMAARTRLDSTRLECAVRHLEDLHCCCCLCQGQHLIMFIIFMARGCPLPSPPPLDAAPAPLSSRCHFDILDCACASPALLCSFKLNFMCLTFWPTLLSRSRSLSLCLSRSAC